MSSTQDAATQTGGIGVEWHHAGFALAFGVGAAVLPPTGTVTVAGWVGGVVGALAVAAVLAGVVVLGVRTADDWRPADIPGEAPDSRVRYVVFVAIALQLFVLGTSFAAGLALTTVLLVGSPLNLLIAGAVLVDILRLRGDGLDWETAAFGYAAGAALVGLLAGLAYWYQRGRRRAETTA